MLTRTTTALLEGLVDPANEELWRAFDERYRPVLVAFGLRLGLRPEDAADAAQEALLRFVASYRAGRYDRGRGRLRSWLTGIARHCIAEVREKGARRRERGLAEAFELPDEATLTRIWDAECEQEILRRGLDQLRSESRADSRTIQAFEMVALDGRRPAEVAEALRITPNDVYLAKHRCLKRLRQIVLQLEDLYEVA